MDSKDKSCCDLRRQPASKAAVGEIGLSIAYPVLIQCEACCNNQEKRSAKSSTNREGTRKNRNIYQNISKTIGKTPVWSTLLLIWLGVLTGFSKGLQCYECLSLSCESGAVCDAIRSTMRNVFLPKRHFIQFDPSDTCPEMDPPMDSAKWVNLSRECKRSDSFCLVSPIEVHTIVDGKRHGKKMENEYVFKTHGHLRGCASRRILLDFPETFKVHVEYAGKSAANNGSSNNNNNNIGYNNNVSKNERNRGESANGSLQESPGSGMAGSKKKSELFYNKTNIGNGAELATQKTYKDGYTISKIYSHVFYIDQGTRNATRCYEDNCNDKLKFRRSTASGMLSINHNVYLSLFSTAILSIVVSVFH